MQLSVLLFGTQCIVKCLTVSSIKFLLPVCNCRPVIIRYTKAWLLCFTARNFGNIDKIGTKFDSSQCHFILNINS